MLQPERGQFSKEAGAAGQFWQDNPLHSRETGKPGVEQNLEPEEKSGQRHPLLPHYLSPL